MRVTPIGELLDARDGTEVEAIHGVLDSIYEHNLGSYGRGGTDGSLQNLRIKDRKGDKIKVKVWNWPEIPPALKGREIVIESKPGRTRDELLGVKVKTDKPRTGPATACLSVETTAVVTIDGKAFEWWDQFDRSAQDPNEDTFRDARPDRRPPERGRGEERGRGRDDDRGGRDDRGRGRDDDRGRSRDDDDRGRRGDDGRRESRFPEDEREPRGRTREREEEPPRREEERRAPVGSPEEQEPKPSASGPAKKPEITPEEKAEARRKSEENALRMSRAQLGRLRNLYAQCFRAAQSVVSDYVSETGVMPPPSNDPNKPSPLFESIQSIATTFFIQLSPNRRDTDFALGLPSGDMSQHLAAIQHAKSTPAQTQNQTPNTETKPQN